MEKETSLVDWMIVLVVLLLALIFFLAKVNAQSRPPPGLSTRRVGDPPSTYIVHLPAEVQRTLFLLITPHIERMTLERECEISIAAVVLTPDLNIKIFLECGEKAERKGVEL